MKKIKVFYGNKRLKDIYPHATKWQVFKYKTARFLRQVFMITIATAGVTIIVLLSTEYQVSQRLKVTKESPVANAEEQLPAVMQRIAECESGDVHYKENGQVITNANTNGSVDLGRFQINEDIWGDKAGEMNLDLSNEQDNKTMALWIYENYGTEDWKYSSKCWKY
jgi:hypothetical protein